MRYVTGDNAPGFLPDVEPRGPWNSWADAVRDVRLLIDDSCDSLVEDADDDDDAQHIEDEAGRAVEALDLIGEDPRGCDVLFMGRAYFIRPAQVGADD